MRHVEHPHDLGGNPLVPLPAQVNLVRGPEPRVLELPQQRVVHDQRSVRPSQPPHRLVEGSQPTQQRVEHRARPRVEDREHHDDRDAGGRLSQRRLVPRHERVHVGAQRQDVIAAGMERQVCRLERQGPLELLAHDLVQELAPDREVGILPPLVGPTQLPGHPISPAAEPVGIQDMRIPDSLREGVAHHDETPSHCSTLHSPRRRRHHLSPNVPKSSPTRRRTVALVVGRRPTPAVPSEPWSGSWLSATP